VWYAVWVSHESWVPYFKDSYDIGSKFFGNGYVSLPEDTELNSWRYSLNIKFEVYMKVKIRIVVLWVTTPCKFSCNSWRLGGIYYVVSQPSRLQYDLKYLYPFPICNFTHILSYSSSIPETVSRVKEATYRLTSSLSSYGSVLYCFLCDSLSSSDYKDLNDRTILSFVGVSWRINRFWIGRLDLLTPSFTISLNCNQL
jgi:hypothetical protein